MFTLISALLGFVSSGLPTVLDFFQNIKDKKHELDLMQMQIEFQKLSIGEEVKATAIQAELSQMAMVYNSADRQSGIRWIDGLNACIRPMITLTFLGLFLLVKLPLVYMQFSVHDTGYMIEGLWTEHDSAILGAIVGFFFGSRNFYKLS